MKTNLFAILLCLIMGMFIPCLSAADKAVPREATVVIAEGVGINRDKALLKALRNAVQQVVGVIIDAETLIKNEKVVKDQILDFSNGFVEKFEKLKEGKNDDGLYEVTIKATVKHRQLIEKLKQAKVHSVKVDGQSLFGATASKMEAAGKGAALLKKGLEDLNLPMSLVTARVINQKPKVIAENDDAIQAEWIIRIGYDQKKYFEKVVPRLKQLLGEVATAKIKGPLVRQDKWGYYSDEKIAARQDNRGRYKDWTIPRDDGANFGEIWRSLKHETHKGTPVYLMGKWNPSSGRSEFHCYYLDQKSANVIGDFLHFKSLLDCAEWALLRDSTLRGNSLPSMSMPDWDLRPHQRVHMELKDDSGKTIFSEEFRLGIWLGSNNIGNKPPILDGFIQPGGKPIRNYPVEGLSMANLGLFHNAGSPYIDPDSFKGINGKGDVFTPRSVVIMPLVYIARSEQNLSISFRRSYYLSDGALFRWAPKIPLNIMKNVTQVTCQVVEKKAPARDPRVATPKPASVVTSQSSRQATSSSAPPVAMGTVCPQCNATVQSGQSVCSVCGFHLRAIPSADKMGTGKLIAIIVGVVMIVGILASMLFSRLGKGQAESPTYQK